MSHIGGHTISREQSQLGQNWTCSNGGCHTGGWNREPTGMSMIGELSFPARKVWKDSIIELEVALGPGELKNFEFPSTIPAQSGANLH